MAKKKKIDVDLLKQIDVGFVTRLSKDEADPLIAQNLIEANPNDVVDGKATIRLTQEGKKMVENTNIASNGSDDLVIMNDVGLPARKRLGRTGGATSKYVLAMEKLNVGGSFFVPANNGYDPLKKLASTISAQNMRYAEKTGEMHQVERTKRGPGNKAVKDEQGNKVKETVTRPVYKPTRKYGMRGVKAGQVVGNWIAPGDGVLIGREQ